MDTPATIGFAKDIRELFREQDQVAMDFMFDLWDYEDVRENAESILEQVEGGSMPCDSPWEASKVELFRRWVNEGMPE